MPGDETLALHQWNTAFEWSGTAPPYRVLTGEQADRYDRDGYVVLPDVFTADEIRHVRAIVDGYEQQTDDYLRRRDGGRLLIAETGAITFTTHLAAKDEQLAAFAAHPALAGLCVDLVGPDTNLYWDQAVYKKPEKPRRFPWHQDNGYGYVEPQQYLTCWVPLTDATEQNGCPRVAVGLHRRGTLAHRYVDPLGYECFAEPPTDVHVAEAPVGSIVVFSSLTPHLTGPNTTRDVRKAYILQYAPAGAERLDGDPADGAPTGRTRCDDPSRQFPVVRAGRPVARG